MEPDFWHQRWEKNELGFHQDAPNPLLIRHFDALNLGAKSRVFVPLCGKTLDMAWLLSKGYQVVGAELSETAVADFFSEAGLTPEIIEKGGCKLYSHDNIAIFVGDIFELNSTVIGKIDSVYDRAALVAMPDGMRAKYKAKVVSLSKDAPQLLICFVYDQNVMNGPPFSVNEKTVRELYQSDFSLIQLENTEVEGGLKGRCAASETVWLLEPRKS